MEQSVEIRDQRSSITNWLSATVLRLLTALFVPIFTFIVLWQGFIFLRDSNAPKLLIAIVAIIWGVGGVAALYVIANWLVEQLSDHWKRRLQPFVFVGPAMVILAWYLAIPALRTFYFSLLDRTGDQFVGLENYIAVFTKRFMLEAFRNNLLWLLFGATLSVIFGLLIAALADRSNFETLAKSLIFLPMAISMVGAGVIWNFIYEVRDPADPQIGLLNAVVVALGGEPQAWTALIQPWNNLFLIVIVIWLQTGFAMVLFSAALKGIPVELLEAARVDGATEIQIFFRVMVPAILGTIITVSTTIVIFTLKIFDVVIVMTGGAVWHGGDRYTVLSTIFHEQKFWLWVCHRNRSFDCRAARYDL